MDKGTAERGKAFARDEHAVPEGVDRRKFIKIAATGTVALLAAGCPGIADSDNGSLLTLQTNYARIRIDKRGFITSLVSMKSGKEYCPGNYPSPLMSLHEFGTPYDRLVSPDSAHFDAGRQQLELKYPNAAATIVEIAQKEKYFRFQLVSLTPRGAVDNIVWGPLHTTVSRIIGDIIGVVREDDWAIGMLGLDDNTIAGPPVAGDCYEMGYYIHSPDPKKYPVPPQYKEGQHFRVGGNGVSDVAFYSHPEEYFQMVFGTGAVLDPEFGSTVAYHARDRRKSYTYVWSLLPGFERSRPRHQVTDPVDADYIGSAVALYACPDEQGLPVIESIILAEGLPHPVIDGKWVRDPAGFRPDIAWHGPHDKLIEYVAALGMDGCGCQDEGQGQYFANRDDLWSGPRVRFSDGQRLTYKEFTDQVNKHGIKYGLHTLCLFLQEKVSCDVTPVPSAHLETVLRTKLARDISATDTEIVVTDPSFLAEKGTWPEGDDSNYLRIGGEMLRYGGISASAPFTLKEVKRGYASKAAAHRAGDQLVKLQQNCYNGFVPDMSLMLKYADWYANVLHKNGMEYVDFDGLESTVYQCQGYYGVRTFYRRLFDTYGKLTGGKSLRVMGSCVFAGGWMYMSVCNVGGGNRMFDPVNNRWGIEGKDIRNGFGNSYFPSSFGIQEWQSDWSVYDAENLEAKSIGWDATYLLGLSERAVEPSGEKGSIFKAFRTWERARAANVFTAAQKRRLKDLDYKFHLEPIGERGFTLYPIREIRFSGDAGHQATEVAIANPYDSQPMQFAVRVAAPAGEIMLTLPDGSRVRSGETIGKEEFLIGKGGRVWLADKFRKATTELAMDHPAVLPHGESRIKVQFNGIGMAKKVNFNLAVWCVGRGESSVIKPEMVVRI